jgi:hypothetical protein
LAQSLLQQPSVAEPYVQANQINQHQQYSTPSGADAKEQKRDETERATSEKIEEKLTSSVVNMRRTKNREQIH